MAQALQTDHQPRRGYSRLRLGIPARLLSFEGIQPVTLIDLSQSGACLALNSTDEASGGLLTWLGFETFGDTVWQVRNLLALRFDEPISLSWVLATREQAPAALREVEGETRHFARAWVTGQSAATGLR